MSARNFPTAQDAENAFYEVLERCDLEGMMAVWAEDDDIVCVHPAGPRLTGHDQIREAWARIFSAGARARVHITNQVAISGMMLAVHSVHENFTLQGQPRGDAAAQPVPVVATNVYLRTAAGWRMIVHHASPAPVAAKQPAPPETPPKARHWSDTGRPSRRRSARRRPRGLNAPGGKRP